MPRPHRTIGETKLKILAIIHAYGPLHGYSIWTTLKERYHCYLDDTCLRNVYHHLRDLKKRGLVERTLSQPNAHAPVNHPYILTDRAIPFEEKYKKYLNIQ